MAEAVARLRFLRMAPRKTRVIVDAIRGRSVPDALATLKFTPRVAARVIEKVLQSAVANAQHGTKDLGDAENLRVSRAFVDNAPTLKRFMPRAQGRAFSIHKRMSHITIAVTPIEIKPKKVAAPPRAARKGKTVTEPPVKPRKEASSKTKTKAAPLEETK
jgi:large subunit ribosomal protein L22